MTVYHLLRRGLNAKSSGPARLATAFQTRHARTGQSLGREPNGTFTFRCLIFDTRTSSSIPRSDH